MGKNKGGKALRTMVISMLLLIVLCTGVGIGVAKTINYRMNGMKVTGIVTVVGTQDDPNYVESMYRAPNGLFYFCETIFNGSPYVAQSFEGYVLPNEPDKIYRMPDRNLVIVAVILFLIIDSVLIFLFVWSLAIYRINKTLSRRGIHVQGEATMITKRAEFVHDCVMNFEDEEGQLQTVKVRFTKSIPIVGNKYPLLYYKTESGKLLCDLIEL